MTSRISRRMMLTGALVAGAMLGATAVKARPCSEIQAEIQKLIYDRDRLQGELNRERDARRAGDLRFNIDHRNRQITYLRGQPCEKGGGSGATGGSGSGGAANPFGGGPVKNVPTVRTVPQGGGGAGCVVNLDGECVTPRR